MFLRIYAIPLVFVALASTCHAAPAPSEIDQAVDEILSGLLTQTGVPAFSVAMVQNGRVVAHVAKGESDVKNHFNATPEHRFRLASVSKVVGATMLAMLVQSGDLDPQTPIADYLDSLPDQYHDLTTAQLLAHTSGLPHYQPRDLGISDIHYASAIASLKSVGDRPLIFKPGESYQYSSHGYTLLGALHESVTEQPLSRSIPAFIGELTGRSTPALEDLSQRDALRSNLFEVKGSGAATLKPRDQSFSPFGTGLVATATDLALFGDAVLHSPMLSSNTRSLLFRPVTTNDGGSTGTYLYQVAFGWRVGTDGLGRTVYHHAGITPGARSVLVLYPEFGLSIAFLSNASWTAQIERTAFSLANIVIDHQVSAAAPGEHSFSGHFDGQVLSGVLSCKKDAHWCQFSDNNGPLGTWLSGYGKRNHAPQSWPALPVRGYTASALKLLTAVGIVELHAEPQKSALRAEIGNARVLQIQFTSPLTF